MIVVTGNIVVDLHLSGMARLPAHGGDEYKVDNVAMVPDAPVLTIGGNAGNAAYVSGTLGVPVAIFGALGDDEFGALARRWLGGRGVRMDSVKTSARATSMTAGVTDIALNRVAYHHAGANDDFSLRELPASLLSEARALLVNAYPICAGLRDTAALAATFAAARAAGVITALDIGPAIGVPVVSPEIAAALPHLDYLLCNAHELAVFSGSADLYDGIAHARSLGARCAVIKRGRLGAVIGDDAGVRDIPGIAVQARYTVGAGDSFDAGFLLGVMRGWPHDRAAQFGHAVAALVISGSSGVLGCPDFEQAKTLYERHYLS